MDQTNKFSDIEYTNTLDDIFDISVVYRNGLLMYGSRKEGREPYYLSHVFDCNMHGDDIHDYQDDDIVNILSLRRYLPDDEILLKNSKDLNDIQKILNNLNKKQCNDKQKKISIPTNSHSKINSNEPILIPCKPMMNSCVLLPQFNDEWMRCDPTQPISSE